METRQEIDWYSTVRMIGRLAHSPTARMQLQFFIEHFDECVDGLGFVREGYAELVQVWTDKAFADWADE